MLSLTPMSENDKVEINRIAEVLFELQVSQTELAERLGKTKQSINRYCKNTSQPTLSFLREIALALGVNVQELLVPTPLKNKDQ
jgi:putative transcriptional regulator